MLIDQSILKNKIQQNEIVKKNVLTHLNQNLKRY